MSLLFRTRLKSIYYKTDSAYSDVILTEHDFTKDISVVEVKTKIYEKSNPNSNFGIKNQKIMIKCILFLVILRQIVGNLFSTL